MSIWRPQYGEPSRVELRGKPVFNERTRRVSLPVTVGGQEFTWEMSTAHFKEVQQVHDHYNLDSHRYDLEVSYEDERRRSLRIAAVARFIVIWENEDGVSGELFESYATQKEAEAAKDRQWSPGLTYTVRRAA